MLAFTCRDRGKPWRTSGYPVLGPRLELWSSLRGNNFAGRFITTFGSRPLQWFSPNSELVIDMSAYVCVYVWHILNQAGRRAGRQAGGQAGKQALIVYINEINSSPTPWYYVVCVVQLEVTDTPEMSVDGRIGNGTDIVNHNTERNYELPTLWRVLVCSGYSVMYSSMGFSNYDTPGWPRLVRRVCRTQFHVIKILCFIWK